MGRCQKVTGWALGALLLWAGCAIPGMRPGQASPEDQIAALPWPTDGLYGMAHDGYLGYFEDEPKHLQISFIQVTRRSGPRALPLGAVRVQTDRGEVPTQTDCELLPGSRTRSYQLLTISCALGAMSPGLYQIRQVILAEPSGQSWQLPAGDLVLEVLPGAYLRDVYVSRWHLQRERSDEYRALLVNESTTPWLLTGFRQPASSRQRPGPVAGLEWGNEYMADPERLLAGPVRLPARGSVVARAGFADGDQTMVMLRPVVGLVDPSSGQQRMLTLQTTFYTPAFSPRDILAFTRDPQHLRRISQAVTWTGVPPDPTVIGRQAQD